MTLTYSPKLQALRGIAALLVLAFHLSPHFLATPGLEWIQSFSQYGYIGVDIFFVLSGIVVGRTVLLSAQRSQSPMAFLYRRLSRIYLGYWPALVAYVAIGYFAFDRLLPTGDTAFKSIFLLIPTIKRNVLPTAWSLTCEIYFYFFAVIAYFYLRRYRTTVLTIAFIALAIWNIGWLTLDKAAVVSGGQPFRFLLSGFCLEFLCGLFLGHIRVPGSVNYRLKFTVIIVGCLGLYAGIFVEFSDRIEIIRVATFGVFAAGCCFWALVPSPPPPAVTRKIPVGVDRRFVV